MLKSHIQKDLIFALKTGDVEKVEALRYLISLLKDEEIKLKKELDDKEILKVLNSHLKKLRESLEAFQKGNRQDLVKKTQKEIGIIAAYLPKQISDKELEDEIKKIIKKNKNIKNPGALIGICVKFLAGKADGGRVAAAVKKLQL